MNLPGPSSGNGHPQEDFGFLFEHSLHGYIFTGPDGRITLANPRVAAWLGQASADLAGRRFSDLLTIGGKMMFETHLFPLLRMQGSFGEVQLELACQDGTRLPVFVNAFERKAPDGTPQSIIFTLFPGIQRSLYEKNLREARNEAEGILTHERENAALREQFIAVLGHDLRNPLSAIITGINVLGAVTPLTEKGSKISEIVRLSAMRMHALINDVMDFARGRLGGGISIAREEVLLQPILQQVVDELRTSHPGRRIDTEFDLPSPIACDPVRLSQLLSNLVGNALTHGEAEGAVRVRGILDGPDLELSVSNSGRPIPPDDIGKLFHPFTRNDVRPSMQGLGLGLYIASQIAKAHAGDLTVSSSTEETRFTLRMPLSPGES